MMHLKRTIMGAVILSVSFSACTKETTTTDITGNWKRRSDFEGISRSEAVSFVVGEKAYVATGYDGTSRLNDVWEYDAVQNFWVQKASLPASGRNSAVGFAVDGKGYIGTGYDGINKLKDFWQYDPVANSWSQKSDFTGSARYDAIGFGLSSKGYIGTGYDGNYLKDLWQYDPNADAWTQQVSMGGSKRTAATVFVYNNKAYICTGNNNGTTTSVNDLWVYDPAAATVWTEKRKISNVSDDDYDDSYAIERHNAVSFVMNNKAYISTGENGSLMGTTWEYDFDTDVWTQKTAYEGVARTGATAFTINNRGYLLTGRTSSAQFDDIMEFFPLEEQTDND
jgi:N-acetylneuraminic acid mutarotase